MNTGGGPSKRKPDSAAAEMPLKRARTDESMQAEDASNGPMVLARSVSCSSAMKGEAAVLDTTSAYILKYQNKALVTRMFEFKRQISRLEERTKWLDDELRRSTREASCVHLSWVQLETDLQSSLQRAGLPPADAGGSSSGGGASHSGSATALGPLAYMTRAGREFWLTDPTDVAHVDVDVLLAVDEAPEGEGEEGAGSGAAAAAARTSAAGGPGSAAVASSDSSWLPAALRERLDRVRAMAARLAEAGASGTAGDTTGTTAGATAGAVTDSTGAAATLSTLRVELELRRVQLLTAQQQLRRMAREVAMARRARHRAELAMDRAKSALEERVAEAGLTAQVAVTVGVRGAVMGTALAPPMATAEVAPAAPAASTEPAPATSAAAASSAPPSAASVENSGEAGGAAMGEGNEAEEALRVELQVAQALASSREEALQRMSQAQVALERRVNELVAERGRGGAQGGQDAEQSKQLAAAQRACDEARQQRDKALADMAELHERFSGLARHSKAIQQEFDQALRALRQEAQQQTMQLAAERQSLTTQLNAVQSELEGTKALRPLLAEAQATVTHLNAHVSALKLQLRHEKDVVQQQRTQREMELQRRVDALLAERVGADDGAAAELTQRLKQAREEVEAAQLALRTAQEEADALMTEIETLSKAFEELQDSQARLLRTQGEREDAFAALVGERLALTQKVQDLERVQAASQAQSGAMKEQFAAQEQLLAGMREQEMLTQSQMDTTARQVVTLQEQLKRAEEASERHRVAEATTRSEAEAARQQARQLQARADELTQEVQRAQERRRRAEEDIAARKKKHKALARKLQAVRARSDGAAGSAGDLGVELDEGELLRAQVDEYRGMLRCNVCQDKFKDTIIAKCFHMFCRACVDRNLETRTRRCPSCGGAFSHKDVHPVFLQ